MVIKETKIDLSIYLKCKVLNVVRSSYYKWFRAQNVVKHNYFDQVVESKVIEIFHKHKGTYGKNRITLVLKNQGFDVNHKRVYRIMRNNNLKAVIRKKYSVRKYIKHNVYDNILNRDFNTEIPLNKLTTDVTQLKSINGQKYYFCPVFDLFNNEIIAYNTSKNNDNKLVMSSIKKIKKCDSELFLHSDQGAQFTSHEYTNILKDKNIIISMSRKGNCYDNACMESFFGHFKDDFYTFYDPHSEEELLSNIDDYIIYYNTERVQLKLKTSPVLYRTGLNPQ